MTNNTNPLVKHFRQFKTYVKLPSSNGNFIPDNVVEYPEDKQEVGVRAMTAADEAIFKNPDALLNGEAIVEVIKSCVPAVKDPKKLLTNDIDLLLLAIRKVSTGNEWPVITHCPECHAENSFALDLDNILTQTQLLDDAYPVNLDSGLTVFVRPHTYDLSLNALSIGFQESKFMENVQEQNTDEADKLHKLSKSIKKIASLNFDLIANSVVAIVNESEDINVTDRKWIKEYVANAELTEVKAIEKEIFAINKIGIPSEFDAKCTECDHEWKTELTFNPSDFFTEVS